MIADPKDFRRFDSRLILQKYCANRLAKAKQYSLFCKLKSVSINS